MKTLCLFTNEFPYGTWEAFLETEVNYYSEFDKVYIFALQLRREHSKTIRLMPKNITVFPIYKVSRWKYLLNSLIVLTDKNLYTEIFELKKSKRLNIRNIIELFVFLSRSHYEARKILKIVSDNDISEIKNAVFYSYRFEYQPYVAWMVRRAVKNNEKIVSRAHRYDLYDYARVSGYLPMRRFFLENIHKCFPCSLDGVNYLMSRYQEYKDKIQVKYLGTIDCGIGPYEFSNEFRLVSCSNVVKTKRLDRIIDALYKITDKKIVWTHFGDGDLFENIKKKAEKLPNNVRVDLRGNVKNRELMEIYTSEPFDLFINVSESEGVPVSIMEAISFGIPCIAPDVGGNKEIVKDNINGMLLSENCSPEEIAKAIKKIYNLNEDGYFYFRKNARALWEKKYDANINYKEFVKELIR